MPGQASGLPAGGPRHRGGLRRRRGPPSQTGLATAAASAGVPERAIMAQTGHRSLGTLRKYIREGSLFLENAAAKVGL